ncbi:MAG: calcium-binding protein [Leptolyngbyaceae cyanobacterium SL_7_1]|nr:calcium-binding protein [Leptolyngbyaceae cyanobacterium SL_7_1]
MPPIALSPLQPVSSNIGDLFQNFLSNFANSEDFLEKSTLAFGDRFNAAQLTTLQQQWAGGDFSNMPTIEVREMAQINQAKAAYAASLDTIVLSEEFLAAHQDNPVAIATVLLEEFGHAIDARINSTDALGDEGAIFARVVQGAIDAATLRELWAETDQAIGGDLMGKGWAIEQAGLDGADLQVVVDGLFNWLGTLSNGLNATGGLTGKLSSLPFLGDLANKANEVTNFINQLRQEVNAALSAAESSITGSLSNAATVIDTTISNALGLDANDLTFNPIPNDNSSVTFKLNLQDRSILNKSVNFDANLGLPGLGLNVTDGGFNVDLNYDLNATFGVNGGGFFSSTNNFDVQLEATLPESLNVTAELGFLQFDLTEGVDTDLTDTNTAKDKFTSFNVDFDLNPTTYQATLSGGADVNLNLRSKLDLSALGGSPSFFPSLGVDMNLAWDFSGTEFGDPNLSFNNLAVYLGTFISDFAGPVLKQVQSVTGPISEVTAPLKKPVPLLGDVGLNLDQNGDGVANSLLDIGLWAANNVPGNAPALVERLGTAVKLINAIDQIATLANSIPTDVPDIAIPLGGFDFGALNVASPGNLKDRPSIKSAINSNNLKFSLDQIGDKIKGTNATGSKEFVKKLGAIDGEGGGFKFPFLTSPSEAIKLILGFDDVTLFQYDAPVVGFDFTYRQFFPILGPLGAELTGNVGARIDVGFGYDTKGLVEFLDNGYDPVDLVKGFYIRDEKNGVDIPEATLSASIKGGVSLDIAVASAGAGGGIYADLFLNLHDYPELDGTFDGKIRFQEIADHVNPFDPKTYLCLFDFSGQLSAGLYAYFQVGWPPFGYRKDWESPRQVLASFTIEADCNANTRPVLAEEIGGSWQLKIGPNADDWKQFRSDLDAASLINEAFVVRQIDGGIRVAAFGFTQEYLGNAPTIQANGGDGNDFIDLKNAGTLNGVLDGGTGDDRLFGTANDDILRGNDGVDQLYGGAGMDTLEGGNQNDLLVGGEGADRLDGGDGFDTASYDDSTSGLTIDLANMAASTGAAQGDTLSNIEQVEGSPNDDTIYGTSGNDVIGGGLERTNVANNGNDQLFGREGSDYLIGGKGAIASMVARAATRHPTLVLRLG